MSDFLQFALNYASRGFSVIPLRPKDKRPALSTWKKYQSERATEDEIREWWRRWPDANVGIATGAVSGIIVLDVDGDEGRASLAEIATNDEYMATPHTNTGKGNHYIFLHPGGEWRNFAGKKPGLDFRGDGGYIVAPPSIHPSGRRYEWSVSPEEAELLPAPEWLMNLLTEKPSDVEERPKANESAQAAGPATAILNNCVFIQHCRDNAETLSEPEWYAMISNLARADGGEELIHELSKPYKGYKRHETDEKIRHALEDGEPHTCQYIQDNLGFLGCPAGGCGVKAPIGFASSPLVLAKITLDHVIRELKIEPKREKVFDEETIGALAVMKQRDAAEYAKIKGEIKDLCGKSVSLNDLEKAVKQRQAKDATHLKLVRETPQEEIAPDWMADAPMERAVRPRGYGITEEGITTTVWNGDMPETVAVFPAPVLLSRRFQSIDGGPEKVELAYRWDGEWKRIVVEADVPFTSSKIVTLRKDGLPVSSESAKQLVKYLDAFVAANRDTIPIVRSVSHMGWVGSKHFLPGMQGDIHLDVEAGGTQAIAAGYREQGSLEEWVKFIEPIRSYPIARFTLAASFAAPLLSILNQRVFIVHNWGPSRGGKTASLKAALSVWGEPDTIMASFNATKVGLERMAAFYNDLPLGIDERQVVGDRQSFVESIVYMLGMGKGKARGSKGGGLQNFTSWRTIVLTTGEEPLSSDSSTQGIKTRALEIHGVPVEDEKVAREIHQGVADNFGVAGPEFVRRIVDELEKDPAYFKDDYDAIMKEWENQDTQDIIGSHLSAITVVMMADYYASMWVFGVEENQALEEAWDMARTIISKLETATMADDATRAMEHFVSWYNVNKVQFNDEPIRDWYGFWMHEGIAVFPTVFDKAMKDGGFNSRRVLSDWADRGWIETEMWSGKRRNKVRKMLKSNKYQVVLVKHGCLRANNEDESAQIEGEVRNSAQHSAQQKIQ